MAQSTRRLMMGAAGAAGDATYIDDVFSTYTDSGTGSARTIVNNIDLADKGGLVWQKWRSGSASANDNNSSNILADTVRGTSKYSKANTAESEFSVSAVGSFNSNGYQTGGNLTSTDNSGDNYVSWTFAKQKGFFDVVTYTGNGANGRSIAHSLGSVPGMIIVKALNDSSPWTVYHREIGSTKYLYLNDTQAQATDEWWANTTPTASNFYVQGTRTNANTTTFVAYVFAGGASTDATAKSVFFYGTSDYLSTASSSDLTLGTGDFTVECWMKWDSEPAWNQLQGVYQISTNSSGVDGTYAQTPGVGYYDTKWKMYGGGGSGFVESGVNKITPGVWYHVAHVRASSVSKLYLNGVEIVSMNDSYNYTGTYMAIGAVTATSGSSDGYTSNMRVVKGTALYTSSFRPPTEPLTNISGTSILCCNNTSTTGKTVGPTLTAHGQIDPSTHSPFDDLQGFKFGEGGNENIIKCGTYKGQGAVGNEVFLGFEPQWVLIKCTTNAGGWRLFDSMRGIITDGTDYLLQPNSSNAELSNNDWIDVSPTGFILNNTDTNSNGGGLGYSYVAIRRPDGYVGKPAEAGTDAFALARGAGNPSFPCFVTGFPVDFLLQRQFATADSWITGARLTGTEYMYTNATSAGAGTNYNWGSNTGAVLDRASSYQGWLWKRGAGFDVVAYEGTNIAGLQIPHSLAKTPEMIWTKNRDATEHWSVYHKGLNGGTNPEQYALRLDTTAAEIDADGWWNDTAPTATAFTVGNSGNTNGFEKSMIAMLFASVEGISNVGYYTGNGTSGSSTQTITTGFQPRFLIIKRRNSSENWLVFDTTRGWAAGNDAFLKLNTSDAQGSFDVGAPNSTGFTLVGDFNTTNNSGGEYIYYAHA